MKSHSNNVLKSSIIPCPNIIRAITPDNNTSTVWITVTSGPAIYALSVATLGGGAVTLDPPGGVYEESTVVTLTADADDGWRFDYWAGDAGGSDNPIALVIDADKAGYRTYYDLLLPMLRPGGVIVFDNSLFFGEVVGGSTNPDVVAIRSVNAHVAADPRVDAVLLNVGDGLLMARRR